MAPQSRGWYVVSGEDIIELPEDLCSVIDKAAEKKSMTEFCEEIFPDLNRNVGDEKWLEGRAVLAPTNRKVDNINNMMALSTVSFTILSRSNGWRVDLMTPACRVTVGGGPGGYTRPTVD